MAGQKFTASSGLQAFTTSTVTMLKLVAATNVRVVVKKWSISFNGTSNTAQPIQVQVFRLSSAGTFTGSVTLAKKNKDNPETLQTTASYLASGEPTAGDIVDNQLIHPQTGYTDTFSFGDGLDISGGGLLGIRLVTPNAGASCIANFDAEE